MDPLALDRVRDRLAQDLPGDGRPGAEVAATIEAGHDKVGIYRLERRSPYAEVLDDALAAARTDER